MKSLFKKGQRTESPAPGNGFSKQTSLAEAIVCGVILVPTFAIMCSAPIDGCKSSSQNSSIERHYKEFNARASKKGGNETELMGLLTEVCYGQENVKGLLSRLSTVRMIGKVTRPGHHSLGSPVYTEAFFSIANYDKSKLSTVVGLNLSVVSSGAIMQRYGTRAKTVEDLYNSGRLDSLMEKNEKGEI